MATPPRKPESQRPFETTDDAPRTKIPETSWALVNKTFRVWNDKIVHIICFGKETGRRCPSLFGCWWGGYSQLPKDDKS